MLIRSPDLMNAYRTFGDYLRFQSSIGVKLSELVILITAREWTGLRVVHPCANCSKERHR